MGGKTYFSSSHACHSDHRASDRGGKSADGTAFDG